MKNNICNYCEGKVINSQCSACLASYKINYDLLFTLMFFFSLPSFFIVKGTGNYLYLASSLIGLFIYLFNIRYIRDDGKTIRRYEHEKTLKREIESYRSGELGVISLSAGNTIFKTALLDEVKNTEEVLRLLISYHSMIQSPSISEQLLLVGGDENILKFNRVVEIEYNKCSLVIDKAFSMHKDIVC